MSEKTILVTGSTSGIGLEAACFLQSRGYGILLTGRNEDKLKAVSSKLSAPYYVCNLDNIDKIEGIFDYCMSQGIFLNGMVHCAGYAMNKPVRQFSASDLQKMVNIHCTAFLVLCRNFYSKKISAEGSSIVALSSYATVTRRKGSVLYAAAKSALDTAVSVTAKEFVKRKIRVNAILPAYVDTRMNDGLEALVNLQERQPLGLIPPADIAYLIEFLLSDRSRFITGAFVPVSAGMEV